MALPAKSPRPERTEASSVDHRFGSGEVPGRAGPKPSNGRRAPSGHLGNGREGAPVAPAAPINARTARQLDLFETSLGRSQQLALLLRLLGPLSGRRGFLLSRGADLGAWNFRLRSAGGLWSWGTTAEEPVPEMESLLGEPVHRVERGGVPFESEAFDVVVVLETDRLGIEAGRLAGEVSRILAPGGRAVLAATRDPAWGGITGLERLVEAAALIPEARGACCRLFTELMDRFEALPRGPRRLLASLDHLMPASTGHRIAVSALKPVEVSAASASASQPSRTTVSRDADPGPDDSGRRDPA